MNLQEKLNRINEEIETGLKLKSADRLRNLINEYPNELSIWKRLAELYYESGFLDAAGRYWVLTEPTDERIKRAVEVYLNSVNHSGTQVLQDITFQMGKLVWTKTALDQPETSLDAVARFSFPEQGVPLRCFHKYLPVKNE